MLFSKKENDEILIIEQNNILFKNQNPDFEVNFVKEEENTYIHFQASKSNNNPFEEKSSTVLEKVEETLGLNRVEKGIKLSLKGISFDETVREILESKNHSITLPEQESKAYDFELTEQGRDISNENEENISKQTVISKDISEGIDIEYQIIKGKGLKEEIVLKELPSYTSECSKGECLLPANIFYFNLELDEGLKLKRSIEDGTYYFTDSNNNYYAHFLPEYAKDALGNKTTKVYVEINETDTKNIFEISVTLDAQWLLSEERVFPVRIDPSIVHDTTGVFKEGTYEGTQLTNLPSIQLKEGSMGEYTSKIVDMGENSRLKDIEVKGYASGTGNGETPFSTSGLMAQWNFNENSGNKANNMTECDTQCNLTLNSFVDLTKQDALPKSGWSKVYSKWGNGALLFDGVDDYALGSIPNLSQKDQYSVELWVLPVKSDSPQSYTFTSRLGSLVIDEEKWKISSGNEIYDSQIPVDYYNWQHIVINFEKGNNKATIFVNSEHTEFDSFNPIDNQSNAVYIGGYPSKPFFKGAIDVTRIYERTLTDSEIYSNTQSGYIGVQYRVSSDGNAWNEWLNSKQKELKTTEEELQMTKDLSAYTINFEESTIENPQLLSFLIAGDSKTGTLRGQFRNTEEEEFDNSRPIASLSFVCPADSNINPVVEGKDIELTLTQVSYLTFSLEGTILSIYVNGFLSDEVEVSDTFVLNEESVQVSECTPKWYSNTAVTTSKARNMYENETYVNEIEVRFRADLQSSNLITDSSDKEFTVSEIPYGSVDSIENLNIGDTVIIKEKQGEVEYIAEGVVLSANRVTGQITVTQWNEGSIFPPSGFTINSKVFKWQRVYIPARENLNTLSGDLGGLYFEKANESDAEYLFKDFKFITPFEIEQEWNFSSLLERYLQYRVIFLTQDKGISPYVTRVSIEYDILGPSMENVMRHGKWFNNGQKQSYWWAN